MNFLRLYVSFLSDAASENQLILPLGSVSVRFSKQISKNNIYFYTSTKMFITVSSSSSLSVESTANEMSFSPENECYAVPIHVCYCKLSLRGNGKFSGWCENTLIIYTVGKWLRMDGDLLVRCSCGFMGNVDDIFNGNCFL